MAKYTVNCQIFALNLKKITPAKKNLHEYIRGIRDKYQVWLVGTIQISAELTFTITLTHFCGLCLCIYPQPIFFPRPRYFLFCKDNMLWLSGHLLGPTVLANNLRPKLISSFGPLTAHLDNWQNRIYNVSLSSKVFTALSKTKDKTKMCWWDY